MATHSSVLAWKIPMERRVWWATVHEGHKELDMTEQLSVRAHTHTPLGFNSVTLRHLQLRFWFDWLRRKESACNSRGLGSIPGKIPWRREQIPTPVFLPGESHGQGAWQSTYSPWVAKSRTRLSNLSVSPFILMKGPRILTWMGSDHPGRAYCLQVQVLGPTCFSFRDGVSSCPEGEVAWVLKPCFLGMS